MKMSTMLAGWARRQGERVAAQCGADEITFAAIDAAGDRLANALLARGLRPGDRVILYVGNSLSLFEAAAGVWKAGGVIVPVSTWIVGDELAWMVADCRPFAVLYGAGQQRHLDRALADAPSVLRLFAGEKAPPGAVALAALAAEGAAIPPPALPPAPDDAAISYTSGTTGRPKGAIATHANLIVHCLYAAMLWRLTRDDVFLITTPIAHRVGFSRLVQCFVMGCRVVVLPRFDAAAAVEAIERRGVTVMTGVPTVVRRLLDYLEGTDHACASLRAMTATGEPFPVALKRRLAARLPGVRLCSFYAMTEAGVPAALEPEEQEAHGETVGRPTPGTEIRLLDGTGAEAAPGEAGEIAVRMGEPGRTMLIRGYFNDPEADAKAFDDDGWFRTGDIGRFDEDGYLHIVDRAKDMILSGGLNIYSQEVERVLHLCPDVAEAAVVAGPDPEFGECVVAYIVPAGGAACAADAVVAHCRVHLASYKKPRHVFFVDALPRNQSGKVQKTILRDRAVADIDAAAAREEHSG